MLARTSSGQKIAIRSVAENDKQRVNENANSALLLVLVVLPHQQRIIGSATYRHAKYARQYVDVGKRRRDKMQIYALGYLIDGCNSCLNWARFALGWISPKRALIQIRHRPKSIPKPICCWRLGHLTYSQLSSITGIVDRRLCVCPASQRWSAWCAA